MKKKELSSKPETTGGKKTEVVATAPTREKKRHSKSTDAIPLPWSVAAQSRRMLNDKQVLQLYLPCATRGSLSMGRFGKGPYADLPYRKVDRSCLYVEQEIVSFIEKLTETVGVQP